MTFYVNDIEIIGQVNARSKHYLIETEDNNDDKDNKDDTADERFDMEGSCCYSSSSSILFQ